MALAMKVHEGSGSLWSAREGCLEKVRFAINLAKGVGGKFKEAKKRTTKTKDGI